MIDEASSQNLRRDIRCAAIAVALVAIASILGQIATYPNLRWYAALAKPSFNPPNTAFAPVWTALYVLMAFDVWRVLRLPPSDRRRTALMAFFIQLALNAAWSWMFFGLHSPLLGLINIVPQVAGIVWTIVLFAQVDRTAAFCLVPLAAWVAFAVALNFEIWRLNG